MTQDLQEVTQLIAIEIDVTRQLLTLLKILCRRAMLSLWLTHGQSDTEHMPLEIT